MEEEPKSSGIFDMLDAQDGMHAANPWIRMPAEADLDSLAQQYNLFSETNPTIELYLIKHLLNHDWLRTAIEEVRNGVLVEI